MKRDTIGELIFWATLLVAFGLYFISAPAGLPWNGSTELALAWSGQVLELPEMAHPVWGYFVWLFGGHYVALSAVAAAMAGGLIGALVNRYAGWRFGASAALVWITLPPVWNRAITGAHEIFWIFGIVLAVWLVNAAVLFVTRRARALKTAPAALQDVQSGFDFAAWRGWINRIVAWVAMGLSVLFAIASVSLHDYQLGEAASAYARGVLDEAGDRFVILNGVADDQMIWEEGKKMKVGGEGEGGGEGEVSRLLLFRNDVAYRVQLVQHVQRIWPADTNLWVAAEIGPAALADVALKHHPDQVYVMTGKSTTPEKWAARWQAVTPYLNSRDRFIPLMRRAFAFEGNTLANRLQGEGQLKEAWTLYARLYDEIDPGNVSALVNMGEMLRRGYAADPEMRQRIERDMTAVMKDVKNGRQAMAQASAIVATYGPVMPDSKAIAEMRARIDARLKEMEEKGEKPEMPPEWRSLVEWSNEMVMAHDEGDIDKAARIARTILSNPEWRSYVPANAIMGSAMAVEGNYVAAEMFFKVAVSGTGLAAPPLVVMNDYADTLRNLKRYDEAERWARRALAESGGRDWIFELTLAQILRDANRNPDEMKALVDDVLKRTPVEVRRYVRQEFKGEK